MANKAELQPNTGAGLQNCLKEKLPLLSRAANYSTAFIFKAHYKKRKLSCDWMIWATMAIFLNINPNVCSPYLWKRL